MSQDASSLIAPWLRRGTLAALFAVSQAAVADRTLSVPTYDAVEGGPSVLLRNADGRNPYSSVVRYEGRRRCTGVFLATVQDGRDPGDAPAYVLTNGHCEELSGPNDVLLDRPSLAGHRVLFNYFADAPGEPIAFPIRRVAYATMKGQDIAVVELSARVQDVVRQGFQPWRATSVLSTRDEPVVVVGAPGTGVESPFLRLASCRIEARSPVVLEANWHWFDLGRNVCADIRPGSSGSPVLSRVTGRLLGLVNTTTSGAARYTECALGHPCEPVPGGVYARAGTTYVTPVVGIDRCFDDGGRFDVRRTGCPLDPGLQVTLTPSAPTSENPSLDTTPVGPPRRRWSVRVTGPFEHYRYKVAPAATDDCRDPRGYTAPRRIADQPLIADPLPTRDGFYFLCVIGGPAGSQDVAWQSLEHPTVASVRIDTAPPESPARVTIAETDTGWRVSFGTLAPDISMHTYKVGAPSETRCQDSAGYDEASSPLELSKASRPYVVCAIPYDSAGNRGRLFQTLLP